VSHVLSVSGQHAQLDPDTPVSPGSVPAALLSAGAALAAVEAAAAGGQSFALVRPPGHHAEIDRAMGFCLFNNVAIAAAHARANLGCERVLVIDWDVHHGNGTQHAFYGRRDVLVFNTHRFPFYPGTGSLRELGEGEGEGFNVNVPLPEQMGDGDYAAVFDQLLVPIAERFRPDLVLVSAGFDAHRDDPLGGMGVSDEGFAVLCGKVREIAARHGSGGLAVVLEGGYDLDALGRSVHGCLEVMLGAAPPSLGRSGGSPSRAGKAAVEAAQSVHGARWSL
jgi:acetoin utilization deacetylase AcuC-like enzyme